MKNGSLYLWITIVGCDDPAKLWNEVAEFKVNLTDLGEVAYMYGEVTMETATKIISLANDYGETEVTLTTVGKTV